MCSSCAIIRINGILCHESGCPDAWKNKNRSCKWCGSEFTPETNVQHFCSESCELLYYNIPEETEELS